MLTVARAVARRPRVLLTDELSLGPAPLLVSRLLESARAAADNGLGVLLVEQHVVEVLGFADRVYVLNQGQVAYANTAAQARTDLEHIEAAYLGGILATD
ncbi:MAG TPA: hypothetical protein VFF40_07925 [Acidimicrobiia bacterium]|nr:hypothetical protein [Acidimicrobiia bacterium]